MPRQQVVQLSKKPRKAYWLFSYRFVIVSLLCLGLLVTGLMRISIGMAMVCMVNGTALALHKDGAEALLSNQTLAEFQQNRADQFANDTEKIRCHAAAARKSEQYDGELEWDSRVQAAVFSAFFYGSVISSLPAGWFADRYGPRNIFAISVLVYVIGSLITPICARTNSILAVAVRGVMGLAEGMLQPCIAATMARWIPPDERSMAIALYTAGSQLCMVIGMPLFAYLCTAKDLFGGWPSIYYIAAVTGGPFFAAWLFLVTNSPANNKRLSSVERDYISAQLRDQSLRKRSATVVPWRAMLCSKAVWACNISNFASSFAVFTLQSYLPTYFKQVLNLDLKQNGLFSSLPFLVKWVVKMKFGFLADTIKKKTSFDRTLLCKIFNSIGCFGCGIFFLACSYLDCNQSLLALLFLCVATGLSSGYVPGALTSAASLAPHYSGSLRSITGIFNQLSGVVAPYIVGAVVIHGTREEWQIVFVVVTVILFVSGLFFAVFGSSELQPWAKCDSELPKKLSEVIFSDSQAMEIKNGHCFVGVKATEIELKSLKQLNGIHDCLMDFSKNEETDANDESSVKFLDQ